MSRLLPSDCAMPLVTIGIAVIPPLPVLVATPAPSRLIHASSVKVAAPRPGACPRATNAFVPPKSTAYFGVSAGSATPVATTVRESVPEASPSLAVSVST